MASGANFEDVKNPRAMIQVGNPGEAGNVEISDILFTGRGATAGLIAVEWNIVEQERGSAGIWGRLPATSASRAMVT